MNYYAAPVRDLRFVLEEMLAHRSLALPGFEEATPDLVEAVLLPNLRVLRARAQLNPFLS